MTKTSDDPQQTVVLTSHPLQRIGAFALAWLADIDHPDQLDAEAFGRACDVITEAMVEATVKASGNDEGAFFLKVSHSFFPNSPVNHPSRAKADKDPIVGVRTWRTVPARQSWPGTGCALCGRDAVGFYGNSDMPLAASSSHRNTVPDGHAGTALCWPCVASFHALPLGCRLTGGSSTALHSYDDSFLSDVVDEQVFTNRRHITMGQPVKKGAPLLKADAVRRLRGYERGLTTGVELLSFTNYNGKAALEISKLDHPTAEWLRSTNTAGSRGWKALCQAHTTDKTPGLDLLAHNLFDRPHRVIAIASRYLSARAANIAVWSNAATDLASICRSYVTKVLNMKPIEEEQLTALAKNLATVIHAGGDGTAGDLKAFRSAFTDSRRRRTILQRLSMEWLLNSERSGPLLTSSQLRLLIDHENAWLHRDYLMIGIFEQLDVLGFNPKDREEVAAEIAEESTSSTEDFEGDH